MFYNEFFSLGSLLHESYVKGMGLLSPALEYTAAGIKKCGSMAYECASVALNTEAAQTAVETISGACTQLGEKTLSEAQKAAIKKTTPAAREFKKTYDRLADEMMVLFRQTYDREFFIPKCEDCDLESILLLKQNFIQEGVEEGAAKVQELILAAVQYKRVIREPVTPSEIYAYGKEQYSKKISGLLVDSTLENVGETLGSSVGELSLLPAALVPHDSFSEGLGEAVAPIGRLFGGLLSLYLVNKLITKWTEGVDQRVKYQMMGALLIYVTGMLELNPIANLSGWGFKTFTEELTHYSLVLMASYIGMKLFGTEETFQEYVGKMSAANLTLSVAEQTMQGLGFENLVMTGLVPFYLSHVAYNSQAYHSAAKGTLVQEILEESEDELLLEEVEHSQELLTHEVIHSLENNIEKMSDEQMNRFVRLKIQLENRGSVALNPLDHLPLDSLKAPIDPEVFQLLAGRKGQLTKQDIEKILEALEETFPLEGITAFATSDIEIAKGPELSLAPMMEFIVQEGLIHPTVVQQIGGGIDRLTTDQVIHLFNRFYQDLMSENWRDCVSQIQETIAALKNSPLSEIVLNSRFIPSLQNARILFMKKVIGNRFPIGDQEKTELAINLLKSMDRFFEPKMIMREFGKLANSLVPMELLTDEQRQTGEVLIDVLMKTFMAYVLFKVAFLEGEGAANRPEDERTLFLMNLSHFFFEFQHGENQSISRTLVKKAIDYQLPALAEGDSLKLGEVRKLQLLLLQMTQLYLTTEFKGMKEMALSILEQQLAH